MVGICFIIGGALCCRWEKIAGMVLKNPCQNGNAVKIHIRFYLNKYFWSLLLLPGKLCLWNNNFTNWKSLASFIRCNYTNATWVCDQFLCMSCWAPCGFDGKLKTEGSLRGLGFDRKKDNIWFQKAEVQKEVTPMLLIPAEQAAKYQHIILQEPRAAGAVREHSSEAPKPSVRPPAGGFPLTHVNAEYFAGAGWFWRGGNCCI